MLQTLAGHSMALCLDGSPGAYYFRPGKGGGQRKFLVFFEGGAFCQTDADCADRAKGYLGSTARDPPTQSLDHPFFSTSPEDSPLLWNWNHVLVRYCDGAYYSGGRIEPKQVGNATLFYRGRYITEALLDDLGARHGLRDATDVVFSGCSAGGIRVFAHLDALRALLASTGAAGARAVGLPDSGFYLDLPIFTPLKHIVVASQEGTALLNPKCVQDNKGVEERCLIANVAVPYLETPIFAWQSRYDTDQRTCEMVPECASSTDCVRQYGENLTEEATRLLLHDSRMHGLFLDGCSRHCQANHLPRDDGTRLTPLQAFAAWYAGLGRAFGQQALFPCADCCTAGGLDDATELRD